MAKCSPGFPPRTRVTSALSPLPVPSNHPFLDHRHPGPGPVPLLSVRLWSPYQIHASEPWTRISSAVFSPELQANISTHEIFHVEVSWAFQLKHVANQALSIPHKPLTFHMSANGTSILVAKDILETILPLSLCYSLLQINETIVIIFVKLTSSLFFYCHQFGESHLYLLLG